MTGTEADSWRRLEDEFALWRDGGRRARFWWRDDDAVAATGQLARLFELTEAAVIPLALAVIPGHLQAGLAPAVRARAHITVLPHGWRHQNHAGPGEKKTEFGGQRPVQELVADCALGWTRIEDAFGELARAHFVPPWNRVDERLIALLPGAGIGGLSRYGPRRAVHPAAGVTEVNCHLDPVDWRGGGGFLGAEAALRPLLEILRKQRRAALEIGEPIGILSHHLVMDDETWAFLAEFTGRLAQSGAAEWRSIDDVMSIEP